MPTKSFLTGEIVRRLLVRAFALGIVASVEAAGPLLVADFEGSDFGEWDVEGEAFGSGPAPGRLPRQSAIEGFQGRGFLNSFHGGDDSTGRLTSPPFQIERPFLTFLIGGGGWKNETCLNLVVDGTVVRSATGRNTDPGGSENLEMLAWDVSEFSGREASIEILDVRQGRWGHLNADQIMQSDSLGEARLVSASEPEVRELTRKLLIDADFIQLPLMRIPESGQPGIERFAIEEDGRVLRFTRLPLATNEDKPDFEYSYDVREFRGREVTLRFKSTDPEVLNRLKLGNKEILDPKAYQGAHRPRFHFSPRRGWMNDVNGPYYLDGRYHLFYQANPTATGRGAGGIKYWAHSVSKDLVHWEEWPIALFPDGSGNCYSGSALLLDQKIPGLNEEASLPTPVLFFTASLPTRTQHLATTVDGGVTWQRFAGNPVVPDTNRDPKVLWHEASRRFVMLLYVNPSGDVPEGYRIYHSENLRDWIKVGHIPNWYECPDLIRLKSPLTGRDVWVLYGTWREEPRREKGGRTYHSAYQLGEFDGTSFKPVSEVRPAHWGPQFYGALTFENEPNNRAIMMGWARGTRFPGEPFNQCATVPLLLQLKAINGEEKLCFEPVKEMEALRGEPRLQIKNGTVAGAETQLSNLSKELPLDVVVRFRANSETPVRFTIRELAFLFEPGSGKLRQEAGAKTVSETIIHPEGSVTVRFLIDRGIIESFWNHGEAAYAMRSLHTDSGPAFAIEGDVDLEELSVYPISNIWEGQDDALSDNVSKN